MAARPSPAATRARKDLEREQAAHAKTKAKLAESDQHIGQLERKIEQQTNNSNARVARESEEVILRATIADQTQEIRYLRDTLSRISLGGVFVAMTHKV